jgi:ribosomal protein L37AE/L43A
MDLTFCDVKTGTIEFTMLGKYRRTVNMYGKITHSVFKCPVCRSETTFYRRKGVLRIRCDNCPYENITSLSEWIKNSESENVVLKNIEDFFLLID